MDTHTNTNGSTGLTDWARTLAPGLDVVSASVPEPTVEVGDLLAVVADVDEARELVLAWERLEPADRSVGIVVLGRAPDRPDEIARPTGADPEGVTAHAGRRALAGALPGALVGALVVGVVVGLVSGWTVATVGAALGGAAFGAVAGAVLALTTRTGWGEAYRHAFVDADAGSLAVALFRPTDPAHAERASDAARSVCRADLVRVV